MEASKRNLVVDEAAFEEQFLRCHFCREKYDQTEKSPKSLPCCHTFCLSCLIQVFDQQNALHAFTFADDTYEGVLKCPTCRVEIYISRREISSLPNDERVLRMMDFLSQVVVKAQNACTKHKTRPLNFFCKTCTVPVCGDCTVLDHNERTHEIVDAAQALNDNAEEFNNVENRSKQLLQGMKSRSDSLANGSKRLDLLERQLKSKIKDTFIEYRLLLERRQEGQIAILHDMIMKQKSKINARFFDVCMQGSKLENLYDTFSSARPSNDITKLFTVLNEMKENECEFSRQADANDDELFVGCEFEVNNEPVFLSEMSCVGEIVQKPDMNLKKPVPAHQLVVLEMDERRAEERRIYEAQGPDLNECDDLMVTHVEPSRHSRSRGDRIAERATERAARLRARDIISQGPDRRSSCDIDQDVDETEDIDHDSHEIRSSYLLRIPPRLNARSANLSEAILDLSTDRDATRSPKEETPTSTSGSSDRGRRSGPSAPRSRSSNQNVQMHRVTPDRSDRYIPTRYDRPGSN